MLSTHLSFLKLFSLKRIYFCFILAFSISNSGTASYPSSDAPGALPDKQASETADMKDPLEELNRSIFNFNQDVDTYFIKPLADIYQTVLPDPAQESVHNVLNNLKSPIIFFNDVLQGNGDDAMGTLARFVVNTTLGFCGLFDPADDLLEIPPHEKDFGETLGAYGVDDYCYLVLPFVGPSNPRDLIGTIVDFTIDPFNRIARKHHKKYLIYTRWGIEGIDKRIETDSVLKQINASSDPYIRMRSIYTQNRNFKINQGIVDVDSPVPFDEESPTP